MENTVLGDRYKVLEELGRGAMGVVYRARDMVLERDVAVKTLSANPNSTAIVEKTAHLDLEKGSDTVGRTIRIIKEGGAPKSEGDINNVLDEARIAAKFNHPAITTIHDVGTDGDTPFVVMELIEGDTIEDILKKKKVISLPHKLLSLASVSKALHYAHHKGVVHRDIKPANLMVAKNRQTKVMDFGVAKVASSGKENEGIVVGTPNFMAPEQLRGESVDGRADLFSLGVTAYLLFTGQHPFEQENLRETMMAIIHDDPPAPSSLAPELTHEFDDLCKALLAKSPDERPYNARDVSDVICLLLGSLSKSDPALRERATEKKETIEFLKNRYAFFSDFNADEIVAIFKLANRVKYPAGSIIFSEGTLGTEFYIIMEGRVQILSGDGNESIEMRALKEGSLFGEMAIVDHAPRAASAVAMTEVTLLAINDAVMRHKLPDLSLKLYRNVSSAIAEHLRSMTAKYKALFSSTRG